MKFMSKQYFDACQNYSMSRVLNPAHGKHLCNYANSFHGPRESYEHGSLGCLLKGISV
jgi:hypothetical protein